MLNRFFAVLYVITFLLLSGCAGRMVCEWQSEDDQIENIIKEVIEYEKAKNE